MVYYVYDISFFCIRVWKNAYNSNAYFNIFQRLHTKIKGTIRILSLNCI